LEKNQARTRAIRGSANWFRAANEVRGLPSHRRSPDRGVKRSKPVGREAISGRNKLLGIVSLSLCEEMAEQVAAVFLEKRSKLERAFSRTGIAEQGWDFED
jgi:hypothetical protein